MNLKKYKLLAGDASSRKFYRTSKNSIIVFSKKNKYINLLVYDAINKCLRKNKVKAPKLIKEFYNEKNLEIEDLGDISLFKLLKKNKNKNKIYLDIIKILNLIQKIQTKSINTFKNKKYKIPIYTKKKLLDECSLFLEWYLPKVIKKTKIKIVKKSIRNNFNNLYKKWPNES